MPKIEMYRGQKLKMLELEKLDKKKEQGYWEWQRFSPWAGQEFEVLRHSEQISCGTLLPVMVFKAPSGEEVSLDLAWFFEFE